MNFLYYKMIILKGITNPLLFFPLINLIDTTRLCEVFILETITVGELDCIKLISQRLMQSMGVLNVNTIN
jgi:hypothetical protein